MKAIKKRRRRPKPNPDILKAYGMPMIPALIIALLMLIATLCVLEPDLTPKERLQRHGPVSSSWKLFASLSSVSALAGWQRVVDVVVCITTRCRNIRERIRERIRDNHAFRP